MTDPNAPRPDDGSIYGANPQPNKGNQPPPGYDRPNWGTQFPPPGQSGQAGQPQFGAPGQYPSPVQPGQPYPPGRPPYGGPGGYSPMPAVGTDPTGGGGGKNFFAALFDFSFSTFVTPKIIKGLYLLITVALALGYVIFVIAGFADSAGAGIGILIGGAIAFVIYLALTRVVLEFYMAVFRIADDVQAMRRRG